MRTLDGIVEYDQVDAATLTCANTDPLFLQHASRVFDAGMGVCAVPLTFASGWEPEQLDNSEVHSEVLALEPHERGFTVATIPLDVYGVAPGDLVELAVSDHGFDQLVRVVERGPNVVYRVRFGAGASTRLREDALAVAEQHGQVRCDWEAPHAAVCLPAGGAARFERAMSSYPNWRTLIWERAQPADDADTTGAFGTE